MNESIANIGERGLLALFEKLVDPGDLPYNDDAVAFPLNNTGKSIVLNIDTFVAKTDAPPGMSPFEMGKKTATMAISDLAAKGINTQFLVASGAFPANFSIEDTLAIVKGIRKIAHAYQAKFLGGDTNEAEDIILSVVAVGWGKKQTMIKRKGAKIGDRIYTTGQFGLTGAGFKTFIENYSASEEQRELFKQAVYHPQPRVKEGLALAEWGKITSCIDSSDGLAWCLAELLRGKKKAGIIIEDIPIHPQVIQFAQKHDFSAKDLALFAGEEFELVFTCHPKDQEKVKSFLKEKEIEIYPLGRITREFPEKIMLQTNNSMKEIKPRGWEHFSTEKA